MAQAVVVNLAAQRAQCLGYTFAGNARHHHDRAAAGLLQCFSCFGALFFVQCVDLVQNRYARFGVQPGPIRFKFIDNGPIVFGNCLRCSIDQVQQDGASFDMTEKQVSQSTPFRGAFDKARNVSYDKLGIIDAYDAKIWVQCCEWIVGNLWSRIRRGRQKR